MRTTTTSKGKATTKRNKSSASTAQQKQTQRSTSAGRKMTAPRAGSAGRRLATSDGSRALSLRNDLQKHGREEYEADDFIDGVQLIVAAGAGGTLRDLVSSVLGSQSSFGGMLSEHSIERLLDELTDKYRRRKVAERKAIRAVINWCSGLVAPDKDVEGQLLLTILEQGQADN